MAFSSAPRIYSACLFFAAAPMGALADDARASTQTGALESDEIVVSATRRPTPSAEVGSTVSVLTAEDIALRQYSFAADALRDTPGVTIARNSAFGGVASARIRGAASGQTLVVIDGIVMNDPTAPQGGFSFAYLDVVDIERIEVLRGPQSILYGADAIGGVISIVTKRGETGTNAFLEGGSFGTARGGATLARGGDAGFARLTVSGVTTDGISRAAVGDEDDGFRSIAASFAGGLTLNDHHSAELIGRFADARAEIDGFPAPRFTLADTLETEDTRDYAVSGRWLQSYARFDGALTASYNVIERENRGGFASFAEGERFSTDYLADYALSDRLSIIAGGEFERINADVSGIDESASNGAVFALLDARPVEGLSFSGGVRRDEFSDFDGATTARVAAAWEIDAATILRASWGQGFRAPSLFELNFVPFGGEANPDLDPERSNGFDVSVERRFDGAAQDLTLRTTFFHQQIKDQIGFDDGYFNINRVRLRGLEVEADWRLGDLLSASLNYSLIDAVDRDTDVQLRRQPKHSGTAVVTLTPTPAFSLSSSVIVNGDERDLPTSNDAFVRLDLRAAYAVSQALEVYGRVENATDADYQDISGYGEPGVAAFGGVRVRL